VDADDDYLPSQWDWVRDQVETYESSGGREGTTLFDTGLPVVILTMRGHRSGKIRKAPVMRVEHDGEYAVVASKGGDPLDPGWYFNLKADPDHVRLQDGPDVFDVAVRELDGDERELWWQRAVAAYPPYAEYQANTKRLIPVFVATRTRWKVGSDTSVRPPRRSTMQDAERVVREMCDALSKHDAEAMRPFFTDDVVYHNIPMDPAVGLDATIAFIEGFFAMFEHLVIETTHLAVRDNVVLTERIDTFTLGNIVAPLPVMGTFEVRDGKISAWRDYFDMGQITKMMSGEA